MIVALVIASRWAKPLIQWVKFARYEWRAAHYSPRPGHIVYEEDPQTIRSLTAQGYINDQPEHGHPFAAAINARLDDLCNDSGNWLSGVALAFLHQRTSAGGKTRIVAVESSSDADAIGFFPRAYTTDIGPHHLFEIPIEAKGIRLLRKRTDIVRIYDGTIDPQDDSAFTIDVDINSTQRIRFRGQLNNDDTITLLPQSGLVAEFEDYFWSIPPGEAVPHEYEPSYFVDIAEEKPQLTAGPSPRGIRYIFGQYGGRTIDLDHSPKLKPTTRPQR